MPAWAADWLRTDYRRVGGNDGWRWYLAPLRRRRTRSSAPERPTTR